MSLLPHNRIQSTFTKGLLMRICSNRHILYLSLLLSLIISLYGCGSGSAVSTLATGGGTGVKRSVKPEDFGAVGDGVTDDIAAFLKAVHSHQDIVLTTGKVYIISGSIDLEPGQKLNGNHATLKRATQPASVSTNTPITLYRTKQIVTNTPPTGYRVGMNLAFSQGEQPKLVQRTNLATNTSETRIAAIQDNIITLESPPNLSFSGTTDIHVSYATVRLDEGCSVYDVIIDGNRDNWYWGRWEITQEILITGSHCIVQNCQIQYAPGEGIIVYGTGNAVRDTKINDVNGNGVHLTTCNHTIIDNVQVSNTNSVLALGHQDGGIIASDIVDDTYISRCQVTNSLTGIGSFDYSGNSNNTFTNNTIYNCKIGIDIKKGATNSIVSGNRIYNCGSRTGGINLRAEVTGGAQVIGNQCYNCGILVTSDFNTSDTTPSGVQCAYNHVENGDIFVGSINKSSVAQNTITAGNMQISQHCDNLDISGNTIDNTGDTALTGIRVDGSAITHLTIQGNTITGGGTGISFGTSPNQSNITLRNNKCNAQKTFGIFGQNSTDVQSGAVQGNQILNTLPNADNWEGILIKCPLFTIGQNRVSSSEGLTAANGIRVLNTPIVIDGNQVLGLYSISAIRIVAGCVGAVVENNIVTKPIFDQGAGTVLINNTVVPP
ncbi:hypothetical protein LBMAG21_01890 [Armatimonadota bacterium]|nr:hypothetical protein LBMAG21_01890 [Armatimonadota bacterium]